MMLAAGVAAAWGFNFLVIDWGMHGIPPLLFVAVRFAVVAAFVVVVPRPVASWRTVLGVGAFMCLGQFGLLYTSLALGLQPGLAALLLQAQAVFTVLIAAGVIRERPTIGQVVGVAVGVVGLITVAVGRGGDAPGALSLTVWSALVVPVPALMLSFAIEGPAAIGAGLAAFGPQAVLSTVYTAGLCTLVCYAVFNGLLARNPSAAVVPWILLAPVVATTAAALLLGQTPAPAEVVGGALLVGGVLATTVSVRWRRRRMPVPVAAASGSTPAV